MYINKIQTSLFCLLALGVGSSFGRQKEGDRGRKHHNRNTTKTTKTYGTPSNTVRCNSSTQSQTPSETTTTFDIVSGNKATLTYFTDTVFQCTDNAPDYALAVNPLLFGFTTQEWTSLYANALPSKIPWCNRKLQVMAPNGNIFTGTIIDSCDPVGNPFPDPNTGEIIGGKCDYTDVIDLYGVRGLKFLKDNFGDDFYQGDVQWKLIV